MSDDIRVLLVDDEEEFTRLLAERLRARGLVVDTVPNGLEAIKKVKEHNYDAVLLDMVMPQMDGIETLKHIHEMNEELQVILLTGHATVQKGVEAIKLGAMDFLEKPADLKKIMEKIQEARKQKMLLMTKRMEDTIDDIIKKMGW